MERTKLIAECRKAFETSIVCYNKAVVNYKNIMKYAYFLSDDHRRIVKESVQGIYDNCMVTANAFANALGITIFFDNEERPYYSFNEFAHSVGLQGVLDWYREVNS